MAQQESSEFVRVPKNIFDQLEAQAKRASTYEEGLRDFAAATRGYSITAVITHPASGSNAPAILTAVQNLTRLVR